MVKLTNEALKKSKQTTSKDLPSTISSLVSADGHTPCALLGGPMTDLFGQVLAPAKAIAPLANKKAAKTKGISGRHGAISLNSTTLQQSLASKLQERLPLDGLMKCSLIWKLKHTPVRRRYCQLAVSVRPINATDCGLWGTPRAQERPRGQEYAKGREMTPSEAAKAMQSGLWPTAQARDFRTGEAHRWFNLERSKNLNDCAAMAMWPTAQARDHHPNGQGQFSDSLPRAIGKVAFGLTAQTESKGSLNPAFVCWLMGYPTAWESCADMVTRLSRRLPPSS